MQGSSGIGIGENHGKLLISAAELGKLLGVNKSTIWSWHSAGKIPLPVRIGGTTRWRPEEIREWVDAGCPARVRWERRQGREAKTRSLTSRGT